MGEVLIEKEKEKEIEIEMKRVLLYHQIQIQTIYPIFLPLAVVSK